MNNVYLYDGSFSSLISIIYELTILDKKIVDIQNEQDYVPNLFSNTINLKKKSREEITNWLHKNVSKKGIKLIYYVFLSNYEKKEIVIFDFIKNSIKYKDEVFFHRELDSVNKAIKISTTVSRETHHMKGFLRFKKMQKNFYYAEINPTNNVLSLVSKHFKNRLINEYFIIKDINRKIYAVYDRKIITYFSEESIKNLNLTFSKEELYFEELWKSFFKNISIKERKNLKCQMNFMPKKYWKYIIEMENKV